MQQQRKRANTNTTSPAKLFACGNYVSIMELGGERLGFGFGVYQRVVVHKLYPTTIWCII
jgi:hypothetical protein